MQSRLKGATGLVLLFFLISSGFVTAAEAGDHLIYLPLIVRPSNWEEVGAGSASGGGISNNSGDSVGAQLAFASDGTPYVAWADDSSGNFEIYVGKWNGSDWVPVGAGSASGGGISNTIGQSGPLSLAIAPDGTLYAAWSNCCFGGDEEIFVKRWNGSSWTSVGAGSASGGGISNSVGYSMSPSAAVAPDGTPYVAWTEWGNEGVEIYVKRWDGSSWVEVGAGSASGGGISDTFGESSYPSLAIAPDGTPYVAWEDYTNNGFLPEIYVRTWDGSDWDEVGTDSASGGGISNTPGGYSTVPALAFAPDGTPYVAWDDGGKLFVRAWNGSTWAEVGSGSASGGGIGFGNEPSITIDSDGTPYVAWAIHLDGPDYEIYVKTWNGSTWEEVGAGSASGWGISNNSGTSVGPSVAVAPNGTPYVAWADENSGDSEIYIKRYID